MSRKAKPLISVVIPVYNQAHRITHSIESVLEQEFDDYEIIISDDGSTDNLMEVLSSYEDRIRVVQGPNSGCATARTRAIQSARGIFIANHDSDDLMLPGRLAAQANFLLEHPEVVVVSGNVIIEGDEQTNYFEKWGVNFDGKPWVIFERPFAKLLARNFMTDGASMYRREKFLEIGGYDLTFRRSADWNLWLRMSRKWPLACMNKPCTWVGKHEGNRRISSVEIICNLRIILQGMSFNEPLDTPTRKVVLDRMAQEARSYLFRFFTETPIPEGKHYFLKAVNYLPWSYRIFFSVMTCLPRSVVDPTLVGVQRIRNRLRK